MPQNGINHPGITALADAIRHNTNLTKLNLNDNTFTVAGANCIAKVSLWQTIDSVFEMVVSSLSYITFKKSTTYAINSVHHLHFTNILYG